MVEEKFCQGCTQKSRCQEVYEHLSHIQRAGVVFKVILAFLLPIVVFIGSLAAFEEIFAGVIQSKELQTVIGLLLAFAATSSFTLISREINHCCENSKQEKRLKCGSPPARE